MKETFSAYVSAFYREFTRYTNRRLQALGLKYGLLFFVLYVGKHPGCTPSELTRALKADWGHSQRSVTKLVEDGFLTKEKTGRVYRLCLTERGQETFEISRQMFSDWDGDALAALTDGEREELFALLRKIARGRSERNV